MTAGRVLRLLRALLIVVAVLAVLAAAAFYWLGTQRARADLVLRGGRIIDIKGTLSTGKLADITVLTRDITTVPEDEIRQARVAYTIIGGRVVYESDGR
jgi:imidazolonepropionase-like amidohydrolase